MQASSGHDRMIEVFFDGACPLCRREIDWLRKRDQNSQVYFTDIASLDFDPAGVGKTYDELMSRIHGRLPDGSLIQGVEVFQILYDAVGMRKLAAIMKLPGVSHMLKAGYVLFAWLRLKLPRAGCVDGSCSIR